MVVFTGRDVAFPFHFVQCCLLVRDGGAAVRAHASDSPFLVVYAAGFGFRV